MRANVECIQNKSEEILYITKQSGQGEREAKIQQQKLPFSDAE